MKYKQFDVMTSESCKFTPERIHPNVTMHRDSMEFCAFKGIFSDFHNIFLWHESEDINQKSLNFQNFRWFQFLRFQDMHDYVWFIAPIDYCVE